MQDGRMRGNPPIFKPERSPFLLIGAVAVALVVFAMIVYATWSSSAGISNARKTGLIVSKQFTPAPQEEITLGKGGLNARKTSGDYVLTVEVPQLDGTKKAYDVWVGEARYNAVSVGQSFDVGPYLLPGSK